MAKFNCTYCQNPITSCRIKCAECPDFDLCLQCFALGAEAGAHKKEHDYHVLDDGYFALFEEEHPWMAWEEESLQDAVEQFGFGNWEDVSTHVKTKTAEECREHYFTFYIHGNIGKATFAPEGKTPVSKVIDHTTPDGGPLSPSLSMPLPPVELTVQEQHELGYMPLRDDFEREYDNDAESLVSGLSLNYDDEDIDITFKLAQVDMYRQRLKERNRRKKIAREYSLIQQTAALNNKQKTQNNKKKLSKEDKEFQDRMRVLAQFQAHREQEQFFESLQKEKQLKQRIKDLMRCRRNGVTKLDEIPDFEAERYRREKKKENKKKMVNSNSAKRTSITSKKSMEESQDDDEGDGGITGDRDNGIKKDLNGQPGDELLSERERRLCNSIGMKPASYITIKTCIIKDYLQRRQGLPVKIRYPSHLDKTHRRKILNFLSENGWISAMGVGAY